MKYDIIGDVHGQAGKLRDLLESMGYRCHDASGWKYRHAERDRMAVFVGDLIDKGPDQLAVYVIVRSMVEAGTALCVLGNHEIDAIAWATQDPRTGWPLLEHTDRNYFRHRTFLNQIGENSGRHLEMIRWLKTLPLWIEDDRMRVVHACWHGASADALRGLADRNGRLGKKEWTAALAPGTPENDALEVLLRGPMMALPAGGKYRGRDGRPIDRRDSQIKWWDAYATTFRAASVGDICPKSLPEHAVDVSEYAPDAGKHTFFGHYALAGDLEVINERAVCVDYGLNGILTAYRFAGEERLCRENMVWTEHPRMHAYA